MMTIIDRDLLSCEKCGKPFEPRSGSGGSVQRFCCTACRLCFHKERLRYQRTSLYAGQSPEPATQEPPRLFDQAERLIAKLTPDERRRLIVALRDMSPNKVDQPPELSLEPTAPAVPKDEHQGFAEFYRVYPLHVARGAAERAYRRIITKGQATEAELLAGAMRYAAAQDGKDPTYIKHPATWLNGKCWLDGGRARCRPPAQLSRQHPFAGLAVHLDKERA